RGPAQPGSRGAPRRGRVAHRPARPRRRAERRCRARDAGTVTPMVLSRYLEECATRAAAVLGHGVEASISLREHGISLSAGSSTPGAGRCDQAEARADAGPCIDAMRQGMVLATVISDVVPGWEAWREAAEAE